MPIGHNNKEFSRFICDEMNQTEIVASVLSHRPLDRVLNWIEHNLKPEHVFSAGKLCEWAKENGFIRMEN